MNEIEYSKNTLKALKNAVNHLLVMIGLPKILADTIHLYKQTAKVYGNWNLHIKDHPKRVKSAEVIGDATLEAMMKHVPRNDWERMAQAYVTITTATGQRGILAQHDLLSSNVECVEAKFKRGRSGPTLPRHVKITYEVINMRQLCCDINLIIYFNLNRRELEGRVTSYLKSQPQYIII